jgi:transcriptional regulator NrdR family protein
MHVKYGGDDGGISCRLTRAVPRLEDRKDVARRRRCYASVAEAETTYEAASQKQNVVFVNADDSRVNSSAERKTIA